MHGPWTKERIEQLRNELQGQIEAGATTEEIEEWANAYYFQPRRPR
jgi:hypothetical protein